ncbi:MAG TPA: mobile mystery protein A [Chitinophagaceae bacterium]|nr:mobile mystery protein A [Chitinophagaceae bacterium]
MTNRSLQLQQLDSKMKSYASLQKIPTPPTGWIKAIRLTLGTSAEQLGKKLGITRQGVMDMERREREGTITLKALQETAKALDMQLVYGFVPQDGSLEELIDRKARQLATEIVMRTSNTMKLEDQENSKKRIDKAIQERADAIKNEMPKSLWD